MKGKDLRELVEAWIETYRKRKPVIFGLGSHIIKCGLNPVIIRLMEEGLVDFIALSGSGCVHDLEVALIGATSEDVSEALKDGSFGMAEETGKLLNRFIAEGNREGQGIGEALGKRINGGKFPHSSVSLLAAGARLGIPVTVHVAVGTDIFHMHPEVSGKDLGEASLLDFRIFTSAVSQLGGGGMYWNIGSAVILPEVFLKALTIARNLGQELREFITVNLDMIQHYRPLQNVVKRPTEEGGAGYAITGHHEILIPLLARAVLGKV